MNTVSTPMTLTIEPQCLVHEEMKSRAGPSNTQTKDFGEK